MGFKGFDVYAVLISGVAALLSVIVYLLDRAKSRNRGGFNSDLKPPKATKRGMATRA